MRTTPTVRSITTALCPECHGGAIGVVPQGEHRVWRQHDKLTAAGGRIPCRATGVALCATGLRPGEGWNDKRLCPHVLAALPRCERTDCHEHATVESTHTDRRDGRTTIVVTCAEHQPRRADCTHRDLVAAANEAARVS